MTEDQVEREVERKTNILDKRLMDGVISQDYYDEAMKVLGAWAERTSDYAKRVELIHARLGDK